MPSPSGARWSSCPSPAAPRGSSNAGGPTRRRGAAACPGRAGAPVPRPRRAFSAAARRRAARPVPLCRKGRRQPLFFAEDVGALGRLEAKLGGIDLRVALELGEAQHRVLAEIVGELHRLQAVRIETQAPVLETRLALRRS